MEKISELVSTNGINLQPQALTPGQSSHGEASPSHTRVDNALYSHTQVTHGNRVHDYVTDLGMPPATMHAAPPIDPAPMISSEDNVKVTVDKMIDGFATLPVLAFDIRYVSEAEGTFVAWPRYLVHLPSEENIEETTWYR